MKWASVLSEEMTLSEAVDAAAEQLTERLGGAVPDLLFAFPSAEYGQALPELPEHLGRYFPGSLIVGCGGGGVLADGVEVEERRALSLVGAVLPDVEVRTFALDNEELPGEDATPEDWQSLLDVPDGVDPCFVILPDSFTFDTRQLIGGLETTWPGSTVVGGLASGARGPGRNVLIHEARLKQGGAVGVALWGNIAVDTVVAQGCRPVGSPMFITRSHRNIVFELDGQPATEVLAKLFSGLTPDDQALFRQAIFVGLVMNPDQQVYRQGDFLVRNLLGVDPEVGAIACGAMVEENQVIQFHLRDARTSEQDLVSLLIEHRETSAPPSGALMFSCLGRGEGLYGSRDYDSTLIREKLGDVPLGGFFCNGEVGPVHGQTFLHGYTSVLGLFRPRNWQ